MTAPVLPFNSHSIARASAAVAQGGLVVYPTDTVYGLGCNPMDERAVARLFAAKGREAKPVPVLCSSLDASAGLVEMGPTALRLAARFWPGALTIVAPLKRSVPSLLHQGTGSLGVRVPASPLCVELIRACGGFLTGTSANLSGSPSSRTAAEAGLQLGDAVDLIIDGGRLEGEESTVVKVSGDGVIILRRGPVGVTDEMTRP